MRIVFYCRFKNIRAVFGFELQWSSVTSRRRHRDLRKIFKWQFTYFFFENKSGENPHLQSLCLDF